MIDRSEFTSRFTAVSQVELRASLDWGNGVDDSAEYAGKSHLYYAYLNRQRLMNKGWNSRLQAEKTKRWLGRKTT